MRSPEALRLFWISESVRPGGGGVYCENEPFLSPISDKGIAPDIQRFVPERLQSTTVYYDLLRYRSEFCPKYPEFCPKYPEF